MAVADRSADSRALSLPEKFKPRTGYGSVSGTVVEVDGEKYPVDLDGQVEILAAEGLWRYAAGAVKNEILIDAKI